MALKHFILIYDLKKGRLIAQRRFDNDRDAAVEAYAEYEEEYRHADSVEVVLVSAESLATIHKTHSHYFGHADTDFSKYRDIIVPAV